ncbi:hypothetical protein BFJ63_vAg20459, partial [Fusarium oxysporum f. sp. narcissi]
LEGLGIMAKKKCFNGEIEDMAKAAQSPSFTLETERLPNFFHRKAAVSIRGNCTGEALSQLVGIENPQEMYNLLQAYCIGTGPVLLQTTLYQFIRIKTSSYETIPQFNVDFERLVKLLLEQKEPISDTLKKVVYLTACENEYPDWTARQRALLRSEHPPTLRSMQQDLIARREVITKMMIVMVLPLRTG